MGKEVEAPKKEAVEEVKKDPEPVVVETPTDAGIDVKDVPKEVEEPEVDKDPKPQIQVGEDRKINITYFGDAPNVHTGFGTVARNILLGLLKTGKYRFHCLGINYYGDPHDLQKVEDLHVWPVTVKNPYGMDRLYDILRNTDPDMFFTINDYDALVWIPQQLNRVREELKKPIMWMAHFPVDGEPVYPEYVNFLKRQVDIPVSISKYGVEQIQLVDPVYQVRQLYHGVDHTSFYPLPEETVKEIRSQVKFDFVVFSSGVNQLRKNYPHTIHSFYEFAKDKPDVGLYLHTQKKFRLGWELERLIRFYGLNGRVMFTDNLFGAMGISRKDLNVLYNLADVALYPTIGEGFGLMLAECMAAGTPVITHNCSSVPEVVGDAALMVETGYRYIFPVGDRGLIRPLPNVEQIVDALNLVYKDEDKRKEMSKAGIKQMAKKEFQWDYIVNEFDKYFMEMYENQQKEDEGIIELDEII